MFKKPTDREFTHDVPVLVPADDGHEEHKLRTRFRAKSRAQQAAFDLTTEEGVDVWLREIVVAFEDVVDDAGKVDSGLNAGVSTSDDGHLFACE